MELTVEMQRWIDRGLSWNADTFNGTTSTHVALNHIWTPDISLVAQ